MHGASASTDRRDDLLIAAIFPLLGLLIRGLEMLFERSPLTAQSWFLTPYAYFTWIEWSLLAPFVAAFARRSRTWAPAPRLLGHACGAVMAGLCHLALFLLITALTEARGIEALFALAAERLPRHLMFALVLYTTIVAAVELLARWRTSEHEEEVRADLERRLAEARLRQFRDRVAVPQLVVEVDRIIARIQSGARDAAKQVIELAKELRRRLTRVDPELLREPRDGAPPPMFTDRERLVIAVILFPAFGLIANVLFLVGRPPLSGTQPSVLHAMAGWLVAGIAGAPFVLLVERLSASSLSRISQLVLLSFGATVHAVGTELLVPAGVVNLSPAPPDAVAMVGITLKLVLSVIVVYSIEGAVAAERLRAQRIESDRIRTLISETNLQMLRAQLRPHFIFNVLNSVLSLIRHDRGRAVAMLETLKDLLDASIDGEEEVFVPLETEIDSTRKYLQLEQIRFGDRLRVAIDTTADALRAAVPQFILQPLAENAVRHGVSQRAGGGLVEIRATLSGDVLKLEVANSGQWLPSEHEGIGIPNTRRRLASLFTDAQLFDIEEGPGVVKVTLLIPQSAAALEMLDCA